MATRTQNHIHLYTLTEADDEAGKFHVRHPGLDQTPNIPVLLERGLTGKPHIHRLPTAAGLPTTFLADSMTLVLSQTELDTLLTLLGRDVYYIRLYHPDDGEDHVPARKKCLLAVRGGSVTNLDTGAQWWLAGIELSDLETAV